jgi:hypothetical protein
MELQEESAVLREMVVCVILSKKVHMNMGPILNGYRPSCEQEQQLRNKKHHMHRNTKGESPCVANVKNYIRKTLECMYKVCPSESEIEVGAPLVPAVELCDFPSRWQCTSGEIWYILDSGSVLLTEAEAR